MANEQSNELLLNKEGQPFRTWGAAHTAMRLRELDKSKWKIIPYQEGYAIAPADHPTEGVGPQTERDFQGDDKPIYEMQPAKIPLPEGGFRLEKCYRVRFHPKLHENDPENVVLSVNMQTIVIQRDKIVTIPERFVEAADHAVVLTAHQEPGSPRKIVGTVRRFPRDILGEGTWEEFREQFQSRAGKIEHAQP